MNDKNLSKRKEEEKKIEEEKKREEEQKKEAEKRQEEMKERSRDGDRFAHHQEEQSMKPEQEVSAPQPDPTPKRENEKQAEHRPQDTMKFLSGIENSLHKGRSADAILREAKANIQMMKDTKEHEERADLLRRADKFFEEDLDKNGRDGQRDIIFADPETGKRVEGHFENGQLSGQDALKIYDENDDLVESASFDKSGQVTDRFSSEAGRTEIKLADDRQREQEKNEEKKAFDPSRRPSLEERKARLRQEIAEKEKEKGKEKGHEL